MPGLLDDEELQRIYQWVDEVPLSRPKRNIARDFADGVLVAEIVSHYFPRLVELHNYSAARSYAQKIYNWNTLNCVRRSSASSASPRRSRSSTSSATATRRRPRSC